MDYVNYTKMTGLTLLLALRATLKSLLLSSITSSCLLSCVPILHTSLWLPSNVPCRSNLQNRAMVLRNINSTLTGNNLLSGWVFFFFSSQAQDHWDSSIAKISVKFLSMGQDIKMPCNWNSCLEILIIIVLKTKLAKNEKTASKGGLYNFTQFYVLHNLPGKK